VCSCGRFSTYQGNNGDDILAPCARASFYAGFLQRDILLIFPDGTNSVGDPAVLLSGPRKPPGEC